MSFAGMMLVALVTETLLGWPTWLFTRIGHPVTWLGRLVTAFDRAMNHDAAASSVRRRAGAATVIAVAAVAALPAAAVQHLLPAGSTGVVLGGLLAWPLVAARSLHDHVEAVARPLRDGDIASARHAVSQIVGRDPERLDGAGIARAALESLAENASDGVVAPLFWGVLFGLPGIAVYKAINTMDSMIGHHTPRHEDFGKAAARLDDLVNLIPARITGLLFALVSGRPLKALHVMGRDAHRHRSPNAGWPEAALAGALDVRLSGPRSYADRTSDEPWLNGTAGNPLSETLEAGLALYRRAMILSAGTLAGLAAL